MIDVNSATNRRETALFQSGRPLHVDIRYIAHKRVENLFSATR
jgi:hypothetical protein